MMNQLFHELAIFDFINYSDMLKLVELREQVFILIWIDIFSSRICFGTLTCWILLTAIFFQNILQNFDKTLHKYFLFLKIFIEDSLPFFSNAPANRLFNQKLQ